MALSNPQFYFTQVDPDYSIKGSRDPLSFQVIWQNQAKALIPFLSTVSINVRDFQILSLAYFLYGKEADTGFFKFFTRFEQAMAYARYQIGERRFNGIEKVKRRFNEEVTSFSISNSVSDQILSNQRAYGIWGKYSRPFRDIGFLKNSLYETIYSEKLSRHPDFLGFERLIARIREKSALKFTLEEIDILKPILKFSKKELSFYKDTILLLHTANPYQNNLFHFLEDKVIQNDLLYPFLNNLKNSKFGKDETLQTILTEIEQTEKILCPLNRIFRYLQSEPFWTKKDIEADEYFNQCRLQNNYIFPSTSEHNKSKNHFSLTLTKENWEIVKDLVIRNKEVTTWRGGAPWMTITEEYLEVHHNDAGGYDPEFDPEIDCDNFYFIDSYISLFNQIMSGE